MKVFFKNSWFSPRGTRYRKQRSYEIPDSWAESLPATAEILEDSEPGDIVEEELKEKKSRITRKVKAKL